MQYRTMSHKISEYTPLIDTSYSLHPSIHSYKTWKIPYKLHIGTSNMRTVMNLTKCFIGASSFELPW